MDTPLGRVTHQYLWAEGEYYRRRLLGPPRWEVWRGSWLVCESLPAAA
jgi:hypothetical protein